MLNRFSPFLLSFSPFVFLLSHRHFLPFFCRFLHLVLDKCVSALYLCFVFGFSLFSRVVVLRAFFRIGCDDSGAQQRDFRSGRIFFVSSLFLSFADVSQGFLRCFASAGVVVRFVVASVFFGSSSSGRVFHFPTFPPLRVALWIYGSTDIQLRVL